LIGSGSRIVGKGFYQLRDNVVTGLYAPVLRTLQASRRTCFSTEALNLFVSIQRLVSYRQRAARERRAIRRVRWGRLPPTAFLPWCT